MSLHYCSPILACGLQTPRDQSGVQHVFARTILCLADAPTPRKVVELFSHRTISHLSVFWLMHVPVVLFVPHGILML